VTEGPYVDNILEEHFHRTHNSESKVGRDEYSGGTELRLLIQAPDQSNDLADFGWTQGEYKIRVARINEFFIHQAFHGSLLQEMLLDLRVVDRSESNGLEFVMFVVDDSNDDRHKLSDLMSRNIGCPEQFTACILLPVPAPHNSTEEYVIAIHVRLQSAAVAFSEATVRFSNATHAQALHSVLRARHLGRPLCPNYFAVGE
jgi:hypothetical protein